MSKVQLSITTEEEIDPALGEQINKEVDGYSLTPRNTIKRILTFGKVNDMIEKSELSFPNVIPKESLSKLYAQSVLKGQSQDLVIETAKSELENNFFNQVREQSYIDNYNQILEVYNLQEKVPNIFVDNCLGVMRHGINVHTSKIIVDSYNHVLNKLSHLR
jgi:hypothetical protein